MRAQRLGLERLLDLIKRLPLSLRHEESANQRRQQRTPAEEKVRGYGTDDAEDDDASALRKSSDHGGSVSPCGRSSLLRP